MSPEFDQLSPQALALSPEERVELAQRLWVSVEGALDDDDQALFAEIERREAEIESGKVQPLSHEEVMRNLRQVLGE